MIYGIYAPFSYDAHWSIMCIIVAATILPTAIEHILTAWFARDSQRNNGSATIGRSEASDVPSITILIPAFNERETIVQAIHAACASDYPDPLEIIVINDGSYDETLDVLKRTFGLRATQQSRSAECPCNEPTMFYQAVLGTRALCVIDKRNGGKADALNAGINIARGTYICAIDADTLLAPDAISTMWRIISSSSDIVAVAGCVAVGNGTKSDQEFGRYRRPLLVEMQKLEYLRDFAIGRALKIKLGLLVVIPGAFGFFRRDALVKIGGYNSHTVGEDLEITVRLHRLFQKNRRPYEIRFASGALAWTEAPETLRGLACQRGRWARAALQTFCRHHDMMVDRRYGMIGFCGIGSILIHNIVAPIFCLTFPLAVLTGIVSWSSALAFWLFLSVFTFMTDVHVFDTLRKLLPNYYPNFSAGAVQLVLLSLLYSFAYRYLLLLFRAYGIFQQITHPRHWGTIPRRGLGIAYSNEYLRRADLGAFRRSDAKMGAVFGYANGRMSPAFAAPTAAPDERREQRSNGFRDDCPSGAGAIALWGAGADLGQRGQQHRGIRDTRMGRLVQQSANAGAYRQYPARRSQRAILRHARRAPHGRVT